MTGAHVAPNSFSQNARRWQEWRLRSPCPEATGDCLQLCICRPGTTEQHGQLLIASAISRLGRHVFTLLSQLIGELQGSPDTERPVSMFQIGLSRRVLSMILLDSPDKIRQRWRFLEVLIVYAALLLELSWINSVGCSRGLKQLHCDRLCSFHFTTAIFPASDDYFFLVFCLKPLLLLGEMRGEALTICVQCLVR